MAMEKNPYRQFEEDSLEQTHQPQQLQFQPNNIHQDGKHVRLRAIETESEFFLKTMNVTALRWLAWIQIGASITVFVSQILLYSVVGRGNYFKPVDYSAIGIWGPLMFFLIASGLTWMATKHPSGCNIGTAMGFQIATAILAGILVFLAVISLMMHGRYNYTSEIYDPEVSGRIFCSFMILSSALVIVTAIFASIHFCRSICCGRQRITESMVFDVVTSK